MRYTSEIIAISASSYLIRNISRILLGMMRNRSKNVLTI